MNDTDVYDVLIIGGGPGGLNAALYTSRKVLKTLLISKTLGGQVADTYDIENYLGFSQIETFDLINKFEEHVEKFGLDKIIGEEVVSLDLTGKIKKVSVSNEKTYKAKTIIIATGGRPRSLGVPGEKKHIGRGVSYCSTCDAPFYRKKNVAVIGGGNSALEAVLDLEKVADKIYLVSLTPLTGDKILKDKIESISKVDILTEYETLKIDGDGAVKGVEIKSSESGNVRSLDVNGVFVEIGLMPNSDMFTDMLSTNNRDEIEIDHLCRTGIPGIFACGDVTSVPFKQVIVAAGEGAKAALAAYDYLINQK